jgi:hypothetical protein
VVLLAAYSATFISFLAVRRSSLPFTTFEGMLQDGTYRLAIMDNSVELSFFDVSISYRHVDWRDTHPSGVNFSQLTL